MRRFTMSLLLAAVVPLAGCEGVEQFEVVRDRAAARRDEQVALADRAEQAAAALARDGISEADPARATLERAAQAARAQAALADAAARHAQLALDEAAHPTDPLTQFLAWVSPGLPEPARAPVLLGGALFASLLRARQLKNGLVSVAQSIEQAKARDPEFRTKFQENAETIRSIQTPAARRIIHGVTSPGLASSLPV